MTARMLAASFESGDVEGAFGAMIASSSVLNAPNCSLGLGEGVTCGTFNRNVCPVNGICGECNPGYHGVIAPSNTPCWLPGLRDQTLAAAGYDASDLRRRARARRLEDGVADDAADDVSCDNGMIDGDETDVDCGGSCAPCEAIGANCSMNLDCYYHWCRPTRPVPTCGVPVKQCLNNCTEAEGRLLPRGRAGGRCDAKIARLIGGAAAQCACREGWFGDDCRSRPSSGLR